MRKPEHTRSRVREKLRVGKGAMSHGEGVPPKCRQLVNDPSMHSSISWGCGEYDPPSSTQGFLFQKPGNFVSLRYIFAVVKRAKITTEVAVHISISLGILSFMCANLIFNFDPD